MNLSQLNSLDSERAIGWFYQTCAATQWVSKMVAARPFETIAELENTARALWTKLCDSDYKEAFEAHPMIGDVNSLKAKFANTKETAQNEQASTKDASDEVLAKLYELNQAYLNKHGFIFIIFASGKSAQEMLNALELRINLPTEQEVKNAAEEQLKITLLRINKGLENEDI